MLCWRNTHIASRTLTPEILAIHALFDHDALRVADPGEDLTDRRSNRQRYPSSYQNTICTHANPVIRPRPTAARSSAHSSTEQKKNISHYTIKAKVNTSTVPSVTLTLTDDAVPLSSASHRQGSASGTTAHTADDTTVPSRKNLPRGRLMRRADSFNGAST